MKGGAPARRASDKRAAYEVGGTVTVIAHSPHGHTREARYGPDAAFGKTLVVLGGLVLCRPGATGSTMT